MTSKPSTCPKCGSSKFVSYGTWGTCQTLNCDYSGPLVWEDKPSAEKCPECGGNGFEESGTTDDRCFVCNGSGIEPRCAYKYDQGPCGRLYSDKLHHELKAQVGHEFVSSPAPQGTPGPREGSFSELYKEHAEFLARTPYKVRQATNEELKANLGGWVMTSPTINGFYNSRSEADADVIKAGYAYEAGAKAERAALEDRLRYVIGHLNANPGLQDTHELFKMIESALGKE